MIYFDMHMILNTKGPIWALENFGLTPEILARDQYLSKILVQKFASKFPKNIHHPPQERHIIRGQNLSSVVVQ
jgi:hypothetical protein